MFLSTILRKEKYRFNYTRKMGTARLKKSQIKLPATSEGKPDWQFMENYVEDVMKKVKPPSKEPILNEKIKLDVSKWKTFTVSDLFKITSSNDPLVSELDLGSTPYIASTESNNGVIQYVNLSPTNPRNVLTLNRGGSVGEVFYQNQPFLATPVDVRILIPKLN